MRDHKGASQKKKKKKKKEEEEEIFECFERHLSFWISGVESSLIFLTQKIRKIKYKIHDWIVIFHWLNKKEYVFEKLKITWLWVLVTIYPK